ncbi:MAG: restriction endonuclease subunit S [Bacteroides fragilis]|uniref:restriction endonuclease subunit S n=1 Tax=Bacteroidaceae TaxID=815 RepID=UPI0021647D57|nr:MULTISPECIES: restriction endonuclease subunit S [Bacteroides]MBS5608370.1 restriction endonuclease subunit S [Bacteroides sp.]MCE9401609.1 restriction endonuclease subunit S [Bacteroides fragilis]MCZ2632027.1 restriction endonuclease subunit S [Bacteroides fragilis]UVR82149.1 restriction endonuclease subunit S [Bacteroides fragilis]
MEQWRQDRLIDILDTLIDYRGKTPNKVDCGIPLITAKIVKNGRIDTPTEFLPTEDYNGWMVRGFPQVGDVVLTTEAPLGEVAQLTDEKIALAQRIVCLRGKEGVLDNTYLKYFFLSNIGQNRLKARETGTTVTGIKQSELKEILIDYPKIDTQKAIASVLSSLDSKIELNRRINDNLEQQVQALFKAWFVDFEPFKDGEFVDSELGMIPKAWKIKPLEYLVEKVKSGDWGKDEPTGNYTKKTFCMRGADFPDIKEGNKGKMPIRYILEKNFNDKSLCDGNVVVEISGGSPTQSTGRIVLVDRAFVADCGNALICTNFCKSLEIKEDYSMFFYLLWQYLYDLRVMFIYENGSNGLKNLNVNSLIERESFVIPTKEVVSKFNSVVSDLLSTKQANGIEVSRLASLRDTLLPKLMSGELKNSEIETEK